MSKDEKSREKPSSNRRLHGIYLLAIVLLTALFLFALNRTAKASFNEGFRAAQTHERNAAEKSTSFPPGSEPKGSESVSHSEQTTAADSDGTGASSAQKEEESDTYIGNLKSHVFHRSDCASLPAEKNRILFDSREQAIDYGYRPCGSCNP